MNTKTGQMGVRLMDSKLYGDFPVIPSRFTGVWHAVDCGLCLSHACQGGSVLQLTQYSAAVSCRCPGQKVRYAYVAVMEEKVWSVVNAPPVRRS